LATALWSLNQERPRAVQLATAARDALMQLGDAGKTDLGRVDAWLAEIQTSTPKP
jgi:hypothetical protein